MTKFDTNDMRNTMDALTEEDWATNKLNRLGNKIGGKFSASQEMKGEIRDRANVLLDTYKKAVSNGLGTDFASLMDWMNDGEHPTPKAIIDKAVKQTAKEYPSKYNEAFTPNKQGASEFSSDRPSAQQARAVKKDGPWGSDAQQARAEKQDADKKKKNDVGFKGMSLINSTIMRKFFMNLARAESLATGENTIQSAAGEKQQRQQPKTQQDAGLSDVQLQTLAKAVAEYLKKG